MFLSISGKIANLVCLNGYCYICSRVSQQSPKSLKLSTLTSRENSSIIESEFIRLNSFDSHFKPGVVCKAL